MWVTLFDRGGKKRESSCYWGPQFGAQRALWKTSKKKKWRKLKWKKNWPTTQNHVSPEHLYNTTVENWYSRLFIYLHELIFYYMSLIFVFLSKLLCQVPADIFTKNISGGNSRVFAEYGTKMAAGIKGKTYFCFTNSTLVEWAKKCCKPITFQTNASGTIWQPNLQPML